MWTMRPDVRGWRVKLAGIGDVGISFPGYDEANAYVRENYPQRTATIVKGKTNAEIYEDRGL